MVFSSPHSLIPMVMLQAVLVSVIVDISFSLKEFLYHTSHISTDLIAKQLNNVAFNS